MAEEIMIQADNLVKIYKTKDLEVLALQGLDLTVERESWLPLSVTAVAVSPPSLI